MSYDVSLDNKAACRHSPEPITINTRMSTPPDIHEALLISITFSFII